MEAESLLAATGSFRLTLRQSSPHAALGPGPCSPHRCPGHTPLGRCPVPGTSLPPTPRPVACGLCQGCERPEVAGFGAPQRPAGGGGGWAQAAGTGFARGPQGRVRVGRTQAREPLVRAWHSPRGWGRPAEGTAPLSQPLGPARLPRCLRCRRGGCGARLSGSHPPSMRPPRFLRDPCLDGTGPATGASPARSLRRCTCTGLVPTPSPFGLPPPGRPLGVPGPSVSLPQPGRCPEGPLWGLAGLMGHQKSGGCGRLSARVLLCGDGAH